MAIALQILFVVCTALLILLILIQKGRGAGLAGAFGGGGQSAFGTKTADVLTKITAGFAAAFFLLSIVTGMYLMHQVRSQGQTPQQQQGPARPQPDKAPAPSDQPSPAVPAGETPAAAPTGK